MTISAAERPAPGAGVPNQFDVIRSEWRKFRTVRSSFWSLTVATVLAVGLGALISLAASTHYDKLSASDRLSWDPAAVSTSGLGLGQLAIGVLGVLIVSSEFSSGLIQMSVAAVPRRGRLLLAKAFVFGIVSLVVGEILSFLAFGVGQAIIHSNAPSAGLGDRDVLRAVIGSGLYLAALGVLSVAIAAIVRNAAAGIAILVAVLFVLPGVAAALPSNLEHSVEKFWPTQAGQQITSVYRSAHTLSPWAGFGWMCLIIAAVFAIAWAVMEKRDV